MNELASLAKGFCVRKWEEVQQEDKRGRVMGKMFYWDINNTDLSSCLSSDHT